MITQRTSLMRSAVAFAAALAIGACSDTTGPEALDDALLLEAAMVAADATLEDINTWAQPFAFGGGPQGVPGFGRQHAAPGRPGGHHAIGGEFSGTREVTFYDADGNEQDRFDALTTDVVHFVTEINGEVSRDTWSASISRTRDMTVSGMAGEETHRTFNGSGSEDVSRSGTVGDVSRSHEMSGSFTYSDVVVPIPGSDPRYPVSGTITRSMNVTHTSGDETRTRSVEITITFDGDETATIIVNGEEMEIDLTTREGRNPIRDRRNRG